VILALGLDFVAFPLSLGFSFGLDFVIFFLTLLFDHFTMLLLFFVGLRLEPRFGLSSLCLLLLLHLSLSFRGLGCQTLFGFKLCLLELLKLTLLVAFSFGSDSLQSLFLLRVHLLLGAPPLFFSLFSNLLLFCLNLCIGLLPLLFAFEINFGFNAVRLFLSALILIFHQILNLLICFSGKSVFVRSALSFELELICLYLLLRSGLNFFKAFLSLCIHLVSFLLPLLETLLSAGLFFGSTVRFVHFAISASTLRGIEAGVPIVSLSFSPRFCVDFDFLMIGLDILRLQFRFAFISCSLAGLPSGLSLLAFQFPLLFSR
jgi:hypothetical protein